MPGPERNGRQIQPPRPPNAWILFRSEMSRAMPPPEPGEPRRPQAAVSKAISEMWANAPPEVRADYERRAKEKKAEHQLLYPDYRFTPIKREEKERIREERRAEKERDRVQVRKPRSKSARNPDGQHDPADTPPAAPSVAPAAAPVPAPVPIHIDSASSDAPFAFGEKGPTPPLSSAPPFDSLIPVYYTPSPSSAIPSISHPANTSDFPPSPSSLSGPSSTSSLHQPSPHAAPTSAAATSFHWPGQDTAAFTATQENIVRFEMPSQYNQWVDGSQDFAHTLQAFMNVNPNQSVFEMTGFDPQTLCANPSGPIDVSIGDLAIPSFELDLDNLGLLDPPFGTADFAQTPLDSVTSYTPAFQNDPSGIYSGNYDLDTYINFDPTVVEIAPSQPEPPSASSFNGDTSVSPYTPPSGAAFSSSRRVAASWKPPLAAADDNAELTPPRSLTVSASSS